MRPTNTNVDDKSAASGSNEKRMPAGTITNPDLAQQLLQAFDQLFGLHPGFRPAHAKGLMCAGVFTPSPEATNLTRTTACSEAVDTCHRALFRIQRGCQRSRISTRMLDRVE